MVRERSQPKARNNHGNRATGSTPPGTLYVVSSPIGDLDDITIRALRVLKTVSIIASEDPAATQALLAHHHVTNTVTSYGPRNIAEKVALLLIHLKKGHHVALVSDSGTPVIYDPGCQLIRAAHRAGIPVRSVPGPSALTAALAISGCSGDALLFEGHLPRTSHSLKTFLATVRNERRTSVFFVSSHALKLTLLAIAKVFPTRRITIALDLTKPEERTVQGTPDWLLKNVRRVQKGAEVAVVIEGLSSRDRPKKRPKYISST
jgi:16S rRNA (cytidine1402-2'-O)-methyltransferase